jgi:hypothetical protein
MQAQLIDHPLPIQLHNVDHPVPDLSAQICEPEAKWKLKLQPRKGSKSADLVATLQLEVKAASLTQSDSNAWVTNATPRVCWECNAATGAVELGT